jgi:hypothetical protein
MKLSVAFAVSALALMAGCSAQPPAMPSSELTASPAPQAFDPTPPASDTCPESASLPARNSDLPEMQGVGHGATLFGLFFGTEVVAGQQIKVVWRMTGEGDLRMVAIGPGGRKVRPQWGPDMHEASSYHRPGDEWGTGWTFPMAGCWLIEANRRPASARIAIRVA